MLKKKEGRNILILFFKLEILTLKQGSGFLGRRQELLSLTGNVTWGLGNGMLEPLIVILESDWGSLLVCPCHSWSEKRLKQTLAVWHLDFLNIICFKKSGAVPGHGAGKQGVWKAWNSCLEHKWGPGAQEYTEFPALAWIVIPWEVEQSLALVSGWPWLHGSCWEELIPWVAGAAHTAKSDYSGLPSAGSTCCIQRPKERNWWRETL